LPSFVGKTVITFPIQYASSAAAPSVTPPRASIRYVEISTPLKFNPEHIPPVHSPHVSPVPPRSSSPHPPQSARQPATHFGPPNRLVTVILGFAPHAMSNSSGKFPAITICSGRRCITFSNNPNPFLNSTFPSPARI
jgi:hypothetical protein